MAKIDVVNLKNEKTKDLNLEASIWNIEPKNVSLKKAVDLQLAATRQGTAKTKTRSEVSGGGKKPWRQKGTGRARAGSTRSPIWVGGGTVFGPTPRSYAFKLNKKVKRLALKNVLSYKVAENNLIAVSDVKFDEIKTKNFVNFLANIKAEGKTIVVCAPNELTNENVLSSSNIQGVFLAPADNASVYEILCYKNLVVTEAAVAYYEEALK
jgi:large subunit ribosomal protein L4